MATALITGISGQDGAYLAKGLLERNFEVYGAIRRGSTSKTERLRQLGILDKLKFVQFETTEFADAMTVVSEVRPTHIFNLAAQSFVADSYRCPQYTSSVNYMGTLNLLEAVRVLKLESKFFQASTSEMYGEVQSAVQSENTPFNPMSPYAVSKLAAHALIANYRRAYDFFAVSGILFNHESELRGLEFVTRKITHWLARIKLHGYKPLPLGNLNSTRDWGYAPEYTEMMIKMLDYDRPEDFVIATNTEYTVRDFLFLAAGEVGFDLECEGEGIEEKCYDRKTGELIAYVEPSYFRKADTAKRRGDNKKAFELLGWKPETLTPGIARRMAAHDLKVVANEL